MTLMEKVLLSKIDLCPLGFGKDRSGKPLPEGARLICGSKGGRFLCLAGYRDAVFYEENRKNAGYLRVSRSFRRFLAVLFAVGDLTAAEKIVLSASKAEWDQYRLRHPKSAVQKETIKKLRALTGIRPSPDPFGEVNASKNSCDAIGPVTGNVVKDYETVELTEIVF